MPRGKPRLSIETSSWTEVRWRGPLYPSELKSRSHLEYEARECSTTEVNDTCDHLPKPQTYTHWAEQVPEGFLFSIKTGRFITHTKRLLEVS